MYNQFIQSLAEVTTKSDAILVAVSGGIDSSVLVDLFRQSDYVFAIAHVNFGLRGRESYQDEQLVRSMAKQCLVPCFVKQLDAVGYARKYHVSIQMAARELRYSWFEQLRQELGMQYVAIAHHQGDNLETFLRHIIKGTGIAGLKGMQSKQANVIRPLLFATKRAIQAYATEHGVRWQEDSSNRKNDYERNQIRNWIVPQLEKLNSNLLSTFTRTVSRLSQVNDIFEEFSNQKKRFYWQEKESSVHIATEKLLTKQYASVLLYHWLSSFGFSYDPLGKWVARPPETGKRLLSPTHTLTVERKYWLLKANGTAQVADSCLINTDTRVVDMPLVKLTITKEMHTPYLSLREPPQVALVDYNKLSFPLTLRAWQIGDVFHPFGMRGHQQKISDFLTKSKCPTLKRSSIYVLTSGGQIVWVVGYRIGDHFKVTPQTKTIYRLSCTTCSSS
ncbi:MAG: tRNA lysidine(34) synthetase TilS [Bacteroidota bacterium]